MQGARIGAGPGGGIGPERSNAGRVSAAAPGSLEDDRAGAGFGPAGSTPPGTVQMSRSSSFRPTRARVFASTRLTITAQARLWLPSGAGRLPGTTTEPAGTRP